MTIVYNFPDPDSELIEIAEEVKLNPNRGPRGEPGPQGEPGEDGADGAPGAPGAPGEPGKRGASGDDGEPGPQGVPGDDGWSPILALEIYRARRVLRVVDWAGGTGDKPSRLGWIGPDGLVDDPADAVNVRGPKGATGDRGAPGPSGPPGGGGSSGRGPKGDPGDPGPQGEPGEDGAPGATGATGATGADGEDGAPGADGEDGAPGATGATGATGAAGAKGITGNRYIFNSSTSLVDPGSGKFGFSTGGKLMISETDADGNNLEPLIAHWIFYGASADRGVLYGINRTRVGGFAQTISGSLTDQGTWDDIARTQLASTGNEVNGDEFSLLFVPRGATGATGGTGTAGTDGQDAGFKYKFNTATSGDPGTGKFLFNHATFGSATALHISETDDNVNVLATLLAALDDSGTALVIAVKKGGAAQFSGWITAPLTDAGPYDTFPFSPISTTGSIANNDVFALHVVPLLAGDVNLYWDRANSRLGIGNMTTPPEKVSVLGAVHVQGNATLAVTGNALMYASAAVGPHFVSNTDSANNSTVNAVGMRIAFNANGVTVASSPATAAGSPRTWTDWFVISPTGTFSAGGLAFKANPMAGFHATLAGTDQTGIADSTQTKINFTTELFDEGGFYDAPNAAWTPPAGLVTLTATAILTGTIPAGANKAAVTIFKNGAAFKNAFMPEGVADAGICSSVTLIDKANGTDVYDARAYIDVSSGTGTVIGNVINSHFSGAVISR